MNDTGKQIFTDAGLLTNNEWYKQLCENMPIGVYITTSDGRILVANQALIQMLGYESFEELSKRNLEVEGYESQTYTRREFKRQMERKGEIIGFESTWKKKNGELIFVRENARVLKTEGRITFYEGTVEDITEKKKIEEDLKNREENIRQLADAMPQIVITADADFNINYCNQRFFDYFGHKRHKVIEGKLHEIISKYIHPEEQLPQIEEYSIKAKSGEVFETTQRIRRSDGQYLWHLLRGNPISDSKGVLVKWLITATDINEQMLTQARLEKALGELRTSERQLLDAQKLAHIGSFFFDFKHNSQKWSEEVFRIFEIDPAKGEPRLSKLTKYIYREDIARVRNTLFESLQEKKSFEMEYRIQIAPHKIKYIYSLGNPVIQNGNENVVFFGALMDVTDKIISKQKIEETLRELERSNQELEQFAYTASHDLQEPLRMVSSYTQLLARRYKEKLEPEALEYIDFAVDGVKRMKTLIDELLKYARVTTKAHETEELDCNLLLQEVLSDLQVTIEESKTQVKCETLPRIVANPVLVRQLFQNLIANAIKFRSENPVINISATRQKQHWVFLVSDNGIGIDPQHFEKIFMIFQRAHEKGKYPGTGIGLALCKKIVERLGGKIWVDSQPGTGSSFYFTLPA